MDKCINLYPYVMLLTLTSLVQSLIITTFVLQNGSSPLHIAILEGHLDVVKALIKAGANVNQATKVQL